MNRDSAHRLIGKLQAVTVERGATPAEARAAALKAQELSGRYGRAQPPPPRRRPAPRFYGHVWQPPVADWHFNANTGKGSDNVKVQHYKNKGNWKIEVTP